MKRTRFMFFCNIFFLVFLLGWAASKITSSINSPTGSHPSVTQDKPPMDLDVIPKAFDVKEFRINKVDDSGKTSTIHSRMIHNEFRINGRTSGVSTDAYHIIFDQKAEIVGMLVSIDHSDHNIVLAELAASINAPDTGYSVNSPYDAIIHTSYACNTGFTCSRKTDESLWFGKNSNIELERNEWVAIGAWMVNEATFEVSMHPEIILWYRWL